jgi:Flp pilus assembly protein TadD
LRLSPDNAGIHYDFGCALLQLKRYGDAVREFEETLRLSPNFSNARDNLEKARQLAGPPTGAAQT